METGGTPTPLRLAEGKTTVELYYMNQWYSHTVITVDIYGVMLSKHRTVSTEHQDMDIDIIIDRGELCSKTRHISNTM